jgi:hypothetical protein
LSLITCGAHGDAIDLTRALHRLSWRDAVVHVARLAGVDMGTLRVDPAVIERRMAVSRRRVALGRWRNHQLMRCADDVRELTRGAERYAQKHAPALRAGVATTWATLDEIYTQRDCVELRNSELTEDDETTWLSAFAAQRGLEDEDGKDSASV